MLSKTATNGRTGSVILLTDGAPMPNSDGQIGSIKTNLVPQFKQRGFPVKRYRKPTNTRPAPLALRQQIADEVKLVIEGLSD